MNTTHPSRRSRMCGRIAFVTFTAPKKFVFIIFIIPSALSQKKKSQSSSTTYERAVGAGAAKKKEKGLFLINKYRPDLLGGANDSDPCIVDDDVQASPKLDRVFHPSLDFRKRGRHVKRQHAQSRLIDGSVR
jgi:hypothetical protein